MKLAVIAHDGKKADMVAFLNRHYEFMHSANIEIIATGTTGKHAQAAGLKVERLLSGPRSRDRHRIHIRLIQCDLTVERLPLIEILKITGDHAPA